MALTNDDLQAIASLMDTKLQPINNRLDKIESDVSALRVGQIELRKELYYITPEFTVLHWLNVYGWRYVVRLPGNFNC